MQLFAEVTNMLILATITPFSMCICISMLIIAKVMKCAINQFHSVHWLPFQFSVHGKRFRQRFANAICRSSHPHGSPVHLFLYRRKDSFGLDGFECCDLSNGMVSISAQYPEISTFYDFANAATISSERIWDHENEFGKLHFCKWPYLIQTTSVINSIEFKFSWWNRSIRHSWYCAAWDNFDDLENLIESKNTFMLSAWRRE